jgi:flagellar protein FlaG
MTTQINTNEILYINISKQTGVSKIDPVSAVKSLPEGGKDLPSKEYKKQVSEEEVEDAVREINDYVQSMQRELQFTVDKESGKTVIKVIDSNTKELIRQIPGEEALNVAKRLTQGANLEIFSSFT